MNKALLKNKIVGGNKFNFENIVNNAENSISFKAKTNNGDTVVDLTFLKK